VSETKKLQGKVAVVAGGTRDRVGCCKLFVKEGAHVFTSGRRQKELDEAAQAIGDNVTGIQGDVANLADRDRLYKAVKYKGIIDVLSPTPASWNLLPWEDHRGAFRILTAVRPA
jgi:NAD(P)-dependent dehydrogenase (short-subunit alcohol dehydrogenase family)